MQTNPIPIIAIDGTTASGKGTISYRLAKHFGFHYLNSGALYRLAAYVAMENHIDLGDQTGVTEVAKNLMPHFDGKQVLVNGIDIWPIISSEDYGRYASVIGPVKELREALFSIQRNMIKTPGLVADGRDMCTHVFTDALAKIYLDGDITTRAERRYKDELEKKSGKTLEYLVNEIRERDHKDMNRDLGRLYPADDGLIIDTTNMTIDEVMARAIAWCNEKGITQD